MEYENTITINTSTLLSLCYMLDDFNNFNENCIHFFSDKDKNKLFKKRDKLVKIINNEFCLNSGNVRKFYNENKEYIDILKKYSSIYYFFTTYYIWNHTNERNELFKMYQYIKENKYEIDKIIKVLESIRGLGLYNLHFNKNYDFTDEIYEISTTNMYNSSFIYLDKMEVVPSYHVIKYKSKGSNYRIKCRNSEGCLVIGSEYIELNSLIFDVDKLPKNLNSKEMFNKILALKDKKKEEYNAVESSVNLNIKLEDMTDLTTSLDKIIENMDNVKTKEELKNMLLTIKNTATKMKETVDNYDIENIKNSKYLNHYVLEEEKKLEKRRRNLASLDID